MAGGERISRHRLIGSTLYVPFIWIVSRITHSTVSYFYFYQNHVKTESSFNFLLNVLQLL